MKQEDDSSLVQHSLNGDPRAFEILVDRYQRPVYNLAFRFTADKEDAEDISQTVFVKAFEKLRTFDPKYRFFSWLYKIAVNESINFVNRRKVFDRFDEVVHSSEIHAHHDHHDPEMAVAIDDALLQLKPEHRILVILNHFQELSYREIGYVLDLRENTVKSRLFSARRILRNVLTKKGFTHG